jgi:signal peptidase I
MPPTKKAVKMQAASGWIETIKTLVYAGLIALFVRTIAVEPFNIPSGSMIPTLLVGDFLFVSKYSYGYSRFSIPFSPPIFGWSKTGRFLGSLPRRGDVVVFRYTRDTSVDYVKRVIGLPGDHIQVKHGQLCLYGPGIPLNPSPDTSQNICFDGKSAPVPRTPVGDYEVADNGTGTRILAKEYIEALPHGPQHHILKYSDEEHPLDAASEVDANNTQEYVVPDDDLFMMGDNRDDSSDSRFQNDLGFVPVENLVGRAQFIFFSFDANEPWWQFWWWPFEVRWNRLLKAVD